MKIFIKVFGCKVNQCEAQELRREALAAGLSVVKNPDDAKLCIIHSCTVTETADTECVRLLRKISRRNPSCKLVLSGCLALRGAKAISKSLPGVVVQPDRAELLKIIRNFNGARKPAARGHGGCCENRAHFRSAQVHGGSLALVQRSSAQPGPGGRWDGRQFRPRFDGHTRAFVKIQDGCDTGCAYCIVPSVRPHMWSRPSCEILAEIRHLVDAGHPEIVLCGIRLGRWSENKSSAKRRATSAAICKSNMDMASPTFLSGLLKEILAIGGEFRVRLSSLEIGEVSDELIRLMAKEPRICRHLHLPLQSGDDGVLKAMRRPYTIAYFERRLKAIRKALPDVALTTDIIVGFPGESPRAFSNTLQFLDKHNFARLHIFPFSPRSGTRAEKMSGRPSQKEMGERMASARALDGELRGRYLKRFVGKMRPAVAESKGRVMTDNYLHLSVSGRLPAGIFNVKVLSGWCGDLMGKSILVPTL